MAEAGDSEVDDLHLVDNLTDKQVNVFCGPTEVCVDLETLNEIDKANAENKVQAYLIAEDMKNNENKDSVIISENRRNKSVFLRAIELSPYRLGIKKISCEGNEADDTAVNSEIKTEMMKSENDEASVVKKDNRDSEREHLDSFENIDNLDFKGNSEIESEVNGPDNKVSDMRADYNGLISIGGEIIEKSVKDYNCKTKDVHFSSPLAVVHEYKVIQASCSQSTASLRDSDDSQNLDEDNEQVCEISESLSKVSEIAPVSETETAITTITPGGDCFSVQINENVDTEKEETASKLSPQESILSEFQRTGKIAEAITLESENNEQSSLLPIIKENLAIETRKENSPVVLSCTVKEFVMDYNPEASIDLFTKETFTKHSFSSIYSDQILKASQEKIEEELIKPLNAKKILASDNIIKSCFKTNEINTEQDKNCTGMASIQDINATHKTEMIDDETNVLVAKIMEDDSNTSQSLCSTDKIKVSQPGPTVNSSQDLFESSQENSKQEHKISDQNVSLSNESEKENNGNEIVLHAETEAEKNHSTQEKNDQNAKDIDVKADKDGVCGFNAKQIFNVEKIFKDEENINDVQENGEISDRNLNGRVEIIPEDMKVNSQKSLFESDTSSASIMNSDKVSEDRKLSDSAEEINHDGLEDEAESLSVEMEDSSQKDLFKNDASSEKEQNSDKVSEDKRKSEDPKEVNHEANNVQVKDISDEMEESSQKDLFESISPEIHLSTGQNEMKYNQNQSDELPNITVEDTQMGKTEDQVKTKLIPSQSQVEAVRIITELGRKEPSAQVKADTASEDTSNDAILNTGEKRKANEWDAYPPLKTLKVSDEDKAVPANSVIGPRKRHSLFKNLVQNESDLSAKKAKASETEIDHIQGEVLSPIIPFRIQTLAEIASNVINSLEEDLIWKHKAFNSDVDQSRESSGDKLEQVSTSYNMNSQITNNLRNSNANLQATIDIAAVTESESKNHELNMDIASCSGGLEYHREGNEVEIKSDAITDSSTIVAEESALVPCKSQCLPLEVDEQQNLEQVENGKDVFGGLPTTTGTEEGTGSPVFVSALEYHSQCSQNSSTGFEPKTVSQDIMMGSQGSDCSVPVVYGKEVHSVTEVYEEGIETLDIISKTGILHFYTFSVLYCNILADKLNCYKNVL